MTQRRSVQGPSDGESREQLARIFDRTADVMDGLTAVSPFLNDKGLAIAAITRLLALGLRYAAKDARGR